MKVSDITPNGQVQRDATQAELDVKNAELAQNQLAQIEADKIAFNAQVDAELLQADLKIIRALTEGDATLINAHIASQTAKRLTKI